ncbi:GNAT family N-acetyltransferase [Kitasatospora sp. NPDC056184]|uniref:GNAT family N-acetyltransferase n=1 Tax=Kitasatospora sp. NPDC056184 TaxID=3345738 RepID=UPI0035DFCA59
MDTGGGIRLERLADGHAAAVLAFERENRAWFARSVPDRGDTYFTAAGFAERHRALLAEQDGGACHFHVVREAGGRIVGRVNLVDAAAGSAELGYRVAESAAGRGVARTAVEQVCRLAAEEYGLSELTAVTTVDNAASRAVLARTGFTEAGGAVVGGRPGLAFRRGLRAPGSESARTGQ